MSIDHSQPEALQFSPFKLLKPSHRTLPEQLVGLSIFLSISFGFEFLNHWIGSFAAHSDWYTNLFLAPWALQTWHATPLWFVYHFLLPLSMWTLWRRYSLRTLKLELSSFLLLFVFQTVWSCSFFILQETLLSLAGLILLLTNTIFSALLFWKKESVSGQLLILPFFWVFYIMGINMAICISNP
jgi:tryptophan-rich sensory protein